jgi:hypothetical protein
VDIVVHHPRLRRIDELMAADTLDELLKPQD